MTHIRISDAARFLGVSDDTVRRWIGSGALTSTTDTSGRMAVEGRELAAFSQQQARAAADTSGTSSSARNRFVGLVTAVKADAVMAQVELQCGPFRVVSLMSTEAVDELGLEPGSVAVAVIKSTNVIVEALEGHS
jgi:molybdopterin-binding protein